MSTRRYGTKCFRYNVRKTMKQTISLNAVEREPVPTRVINPNASEASYKPKQRRYRTLCTEMVLYRNVARRICIYIYCMDHTYMLMHGEFHDILSCKSSAAVFA